MTFGDIQCQVKEKFKLWRSLIAIASVDVIDSASAVLKKNSGVADKKKK
jgi:hypothetical protein